jgi:hypothetical protein
METFNTNPETPVQRQKTPTEHNRSGRIMGGLLIVAVGLIFLGRKAGMDFPHWIFSFETVLIALGLYLGFRHNFKGFGWLIPILIGGFLLIDDFYPYYDIAEFTWPLIIIGFGLFIIFRAGKKRSDWKKWEGGHRLENLADDYIDSTVVFGGVKKNVISKNFKGGEAVTIFGGTELNLTQADVNGVIVLDLTQIFGGTKLIVPPHWKIQSKDLVAIFGGVEDKRLISNPAGEEPNKVLVLEGTCIFGGIDIKSY